MAVFYAMVEGLRFRAAMDGEMEHVGFYSSFAVSASNASDAVSLIRRKLQERLLKNDIRASTNAICGSFCWIKTFGEYAEAPQREPDGFVFFRFRAWHVPGLLLTRLWLKWNRSFRVIDVDECRQE